MRPVPKVGQTVYSLNTGNAARNVEQRLTPVIVTKVGRKYFTVGEGWQATEYNLENWVEKTIYSPSSCLYISEQEYAEENEAAEICELLYKTFKHGHNILKVPLASLRKLAEIIKGSALSEKQEAGK
jgi:hypothetical protein